MDVGRSSRCPHKHHHRSNSLQIVQNGGGGDGGQSGVVLLVTVVKVWSGGAAVERKQVMDVGRSSRCPHQLHTLTTIVPILFKSFKSFKMGVGEVGGTRRMVGRTIGVTYRVHGHGCGWITGVRVSQKSPKSSKEHLQSNIHSPVCIKDHKVDSTT